MKKHVLGYVTSCSLILFFILNNNSVAQQQNTRLQNIFSLPEESNQNNLTATIQSFPELHTSGRNGSFLGEEVAHIGDVNNDGIDDWAIGVKDAALYPSGLKTGKVYIYFGGNNLVNEKNPDIVLNGEYDTDQFGVSVAFAGDVNNDGFNDVIVGASWCLNRYGRAYIFFGGAPMDAIPDVIMTGDEFRDFFGLEVSSAGDVNNDGYSDVLVGSQNDEGGALAGRAYLFLGGPEMNNLADLIINGQAIGDLFSSSMAPAGDVNNDGFDDYIIGAYLSDGGDVDGGSAYIYYGGTNLNNVADVVLSGENSFDQLGISVSSAGDVNKDGFDDVIAGANVRNRAYIFYGGTNMNSIADVVLEGESVYDAFGVSVSYAGDVNADGFSDVIVGAHSAGFNVCGKAYVYYGGENMDSSPDAFFEGAVNYDFFANCVSSTGDINNDGYSDLIVGAKWSDAGGRDAGRAYIYFGGTNTDSTADIILTGEGSYDYFGNCVASAGDVNGDGYSDLIVAAYSDYINGREAGCVYLYFGSPGMDNKADLIFIGEAKGDLFGTSIASAGDVNNDGYDDIIVGAGSHGGGINNGNAYIYFGGTNMDNTADVILAGEAYFDYFGNSVASAGDINRDGYADVIVGASLADASGFDVGRAYIFLGGQNMDATPDIILSGENNYDSFGCSVSSAGDVNGDGYSDVVVGASMNDAAGDAAGRAYLYLGGLNMDNTADATFTGEAEIDFFGTSTSKAGDVNGDGYSDVLIGATLAGNSAGRAYIYYGSTNMNNTADVTFTGETIGDVLGCSVSGIGDINKDNFADIIIAARKFSGTGFERGRTYIYFGGAEMDNQVDAYITGEASSDNLGNSVASAGDVDKDGKPDIIIGAFQSAAIGYNVGRAYLVYGSAIVTSLPDEANALPDGFELYQNYPNPFNPETNITFALPEQADVKLVIYDILGREVITLENSSLVSGYYERRWNGFDAKGNNVSSGVYLFSLIAKSSNGKEYSKVMKMIMMR